MTSKPKAPVLIFIHGGAWRRGTAKENGFAAEVFVNAGVHFVVPDFAWVQDAQDSLRTVAHELRAAIGWIFQNAGGFGADKSCINISAHSSGAHLAGVLLTTD